MSSFVAFEDKEEGRSFLIDENAAEVAGRTTLPNRPSTIHESGEASPVSSGVLHELPSRPLQISQSPVKDAKSRYQEQIQQWMSSSQENRPREPTGTMTVPPLDLGLARRPEEEVRLDVDAPEAPRAPRFLVKTLASMQDIIRFGTNKHNTTSFQGRHRCLVRVRGCQLTKPMRDLVRQKEIANSKEDEQPWTRPIWSIGREPDGDSGFEQVEEIVGKARSYVGPKAEQEDQASILYWLMMTTPYLKVAGFVVLATVDQVVALVLHVFWSKNDFMCDYDGEPRGSVKAEDSMLILLAAIAALHFVRTVTKLVKTDGGGDLIGLRFFYSKELFGYFGLWVNNADFFLNAASATALALHAADCSPGENEGLYHVIVRRVHGHLHLIRGLFAFQRCFSMKQYLRQQLQIAVSVNKRRFISADTKINLDLTYISDRLIAMAIPCVDFVMYRNDIRDVARFFAQFHYGTFLVYNLCEGHEEGGNGNYDTSLLYNQVQRITFRDHNVPRFRCLVKFCETAAAWLNASDKHVVAVHCQGGKGRTGTLCAALLLWTGLCDSAPAALDKFALRRTQRMRYGESLQGVASPSQIRYVHYMEAYVYQAVDYQVLDYVLLHQVSLTNMRPAAVKGSCLTFIIEVDGQVQYDHGKEHGFLSWEQCALTDFSFNTNDVVVAGDVTVRFFAVDEAEAMALAGSNPRATRGVVGEGARTIRYGTTTGKQMLFVSFHTAFHRGNVTFVKNEVDGAYHAPAEQFSAEFAVTLHVRPYEGKAADSVSSPVSRGGGKAASPQLRGLEEFMPRKINCAWQFLDTHLAVQHVFHRLCPRPVAFRPGEPLMDTVRPGHLLLHYIVEGSTTTEPPSALVTMQSVRSVFECDVHGAGDFVHCGMQRFHAGAPQRYFAGSAAIKTRTMHIPLTPEGYLPIDAPDVDQAELASLYSYLAHQVSARSRRYRDKISELNKLNATKRKKGSVESRSGKKTLGQLVHRFGIPKTEALFCGSVAQRERSSGSLEGGHAYVVSNWVLFHARRSLWHPAHPHELILRIKDIASVHATRELVDITMDSARAAAADDAPAINRGSSLASAADETPLEGPAPAAGWRALNPLAWLSARRGGVAGGGKNGQVTLMRKRFVGEKVTLQLPDEESGEAFAGAMQERMREVQNSEHQQQSRDLSALKFGYILPEEADDEGGRDFLQHLLNISEVRVFAPGEELIHMGDGQRKLYHIISGSALRYSHSNNHMEDLGPGEMVGEWRFLAYNSGFADPSQVVASTEVKCFVSPFEQVQTLCSLRQEFAVRFYRGLALSCIIRARQFRRLYQQNLQRAAREKEEAEGGSRCRVPSPEPRGRQAHSRMHFRSSARNVLAGGALPDPSERRTSTSRSSTERTRQTDKDQ